MSEVVEQAPGSTLQAERVRRVTAAFVSMPERYLGADDDFDATVHVRLGDVGRSWEICLSPRRCSVRTSPRRDADVVIGTDASTWLALREGRMSGVDAFAQGRLYARGDLDLALGFEGMFKLPGGRPPLVRVHDVRIDGATISTLTAGSGAERVICLHGLGANKTSFFSTVSELTPEHTVHAIDLPGFGSSSKPARAPYDAPYFARSVRRFMDTLGISRAHFVGNSMGGRIALELALADPGRVSSLSLLAPALAWKRGRELVPLVKLLRPEFAAIPHALRQARVRDQFLSLFAHPDRLDPAVADIACDEFCRTYRTLAARIAFYAAARNIYLDPPWGEGGFWTRLQGLDVPGLFVWGDRDRLVPAAFSEHVAELLPGVEQAVLRDCGHVPQVELPDETNALVKRLIASASLAPIEHPLARTA